MLNDVTLFHFGYPTLMRSMYETEAGKAGIEKGLAEGARTMMELIPYEIEAMKEVVREKITLFGSANACH